MDNLNAGGRTGAASADVENNDYTLLMSAMQVSVSKHLLDEHYTMIWGNDFYYKVIGYSQEEYEELFHNRPDLFYPYHHYEDELKRVQEAVVEALEAGRPGYSLVSRMPVKGGGHTWVRMTATFTDEYADGCQISYTVITNVNDLIQAKQAQAIAVNNLPGFVAKVRIKGPLDLEFMDVNNKFAAFFGAGPRDASFNPVLRQNLQLNEEAIRTQYELAVKGEHIHFLAKLLGQEGQTAWMQVNGDCVDWVGGCPVYLLIYIDVTDVTELREMQKKLETQAQQLRDALAVAQKANDAKRTFLSRMSHEIRTPMNAIIGMTTIAAAHIGDDARIEDCLGKISFSSQHLLSLINDVLDMSKIEDGKLTVNHEPFSLQQLLESVTTIIYPQAAEQGVVFRESVQDVREEELTGDAMRVNQILLNLLSNAIKFTPRGGNVRLEVKQLARRDGRTALRFTVSDTGRGMSEEFLERLYTPFEQENTAEISQFGGTGLGMSITKNLVTLLDGTISVRSKLNAGTSFTVELPFDAASPQEAEKFPVMDSLKVLISDNDRDGCAYTSHLLDKFGIAAKQVLSGEEAVEEIRCAHETGENYDVCLIDWQMPDIDGIEITRRIRTIVGPETTIVIVTAYDYSGIEQDARAAGADLFLSKPFFASSLYNALLSATSLGKKVPKAGAAAAADTLRDRKILLAEDNAMNLEIAVELLRMAGADVHCVWNGREAVDWFFSPEGRDCDAILMDIQMPGMDGYQAARAIRACTCENARTIPIIAMTANAFQEDVAAAMDAGMDAHIAKPIDMSGLYRTLQGLLQKPE